MYLQSIFGGHRNHGSEVLAEFNLLNIETNSEKVRNRRNIQTSWKLLVWKWLLFVTYLAWPLHEIIQNNFYWYCIFCPVFFAFCYDDKQFEKQSFTKHPNLLHWGSTYTQKAHIFITLKAHTLTILITVPLLYTFLNNQSSIKTPAFLLYLSLDTLTLESRIDIPPHSQTPPIPTLLQLNFEKSKMEKKTFEHLFSIQDFVSY